MKHILTGIALLLVIALLCFTVGAICVGIAEHTITLTERALYSHGMQRLDTVNEAIANWEKHSPWLLAVQYHDQVDNVRSMLEELRHCAESGNDEEFISLCAKLRLRLENIKAASSLKLSQIL